MTYNRNNSMERMTDLERSGYGIFREPKRKPHSLWREVWTGLLMFVWCVAFGMFITALAYAPK